MERIIDEDLIRRQDAISAIDEWGLLDGLSEGQAKEILSDKNKVPSDNRLTKIADLVEGTIDHFDLDDAMDLLYQIKEVLK